jgi:hypothetical protein
MQRFRLYYGPAMPSVLEELTWVDLFLAVSGSAVMTVSSAGLSGTLDEAIESLRQGAPGVFFYFRTCHQPGINSRFRAEGGPVQRFRLSTVSWSALALAGFLWACNDGPTRPSTPPVRPPAEPAPVTAIRLELTGPNGVPPGSSAQYSAVLYQSDGSSRDVSNEAVWATDNQKFLTISSNGLATGQERGETSVRVSAASLITTKRVMVLPAGTYRLAGTVRDSGTWVLGARVEVTAGMGQGLAATTTSSFALYGVAGDIEVRATANGYQEQRHRLTVTDHQTLDIDFVPSQPRPDVSGTYALTVVAAPECRAALPAEARTRTYTAVITQDGPALTVTLQGSRFLSRNGRTLNRFTGTVVPSHISLSIGKWNGDYYYFSGPDIVDQLTDTTSFTMSGTVIATASSNPLANTLYGTIETLQDTPEGWFTAVAVCGPAWHEFVMRKQ